MPPTHAAPGGFGLTVSHVVQAVRFNLRALTNDKTFCFFLAASAAGVGSVAVPVVRRLQTKMKKDYRPRSLIYSSKSKLWKKQTKSYQTRMRA